MKSKLEGILDNLSCICRPISIFLYGSRSRDDYQKNSDFEIGVLMNEADYVSRGEINEKVGLFNGYKVYPFKLEDLENKELDTPFHNKIFLRELSDYGKTLKGQRIVESLKSPSIDVRDLLEDVNFCLGKAEASRNSYENGDLKTSREGFYKSCLFGTRDLEIFQFKIFPKGYDEIYEISKSLELGEEDKDYSELVEKAHNIRKGCASPSQKNFYENISYLRKIIERRMRNFLDKKGNKVVLE